ncbi:MAG: hypothetical protein ACK5FX_10225 [Flavobacteriia bacterium]
MFRSLLLITAFACCQLVHAQWSLNTTPTYPELIEYYQKIDREHKEIELYAMGESDYGLPIYVCIINGAEDSLKTFQKARRETTILINNAIHAGEPDGVNASLIWIDNWIKEGKKMNGLPVIAIIPAYNVGGMMNRNSFSRANQNGPEEYGFRGNAQNLDLNRDFIKMDSENAKTFAKIFHSLDPDVFVDTHVSNGADYQYTLTYISSTKERMAPALMKLTYQELLPALTVQLKKKKWDLFPYVDLVNETPKDGIQAFNDLPRYAMGYAALFDALSFTVETHMLKPFSQRVAATHDFLCELIQWTISNKNVIEKARNESHEYWQRQTKYAFNYELTEKKDSLLFKGYEAEFPQSEVTGLPRLKYNVNRPYQRFIPFFSQHAAKDSIHIPKYFMVGGQCKSIIERLKLNNIQFTVITNDTLLKVENDQVSSFESYKQPYEGHFYHNELTSSNDISLKEFKAGDIIIPTNQKNQRFILSTLIPQAEDSYFRWNFFDSYLQQKEHFSSYVFEEKAAEILRNEPKLKEKFEAMKIQNPNFKSSAREQLEFIYRNSVYFEKSFHQLPVFRSVE